MRSTSALKCGVTWRGRGRNKEGQLGHGFRDPPRVPTPQLVQGLRHERIIGAAAGPSHTLCYTQVLP
eukprot:2028005-Rhodomonas_salina.1